LTISGNCFLFNFKDSEMNKSLVLAALVAAFALAACGKKEEAAAAGPTKKDGTPDKRYKENKTTPKQK
jgi:uncharacterized lipoprotein YehR (DUF1307 family)